MTALLPFDQVLDHFDPVIGLEVHVELNTTTKIFSAAPNAFGDAPNTNITEVDLGLPGTLPSVSMPVLEAGIKLGLALNCTIATTCCFARKHYFYPDTPKNFQISQHSDPIASNGWLDVELDDGEVFRVDIERAHLEEDAGKLTHMSASGRIHSAAYALADYNRAGVPLLEIVTKPLVGAGARAPELAGAYVRAIRDIVQALDISAARMERGNLRCDVNVSLMTTHDEQFGTRTETKNLNSLRAVEQSVSYEMRRQAGVLMAGSTVTQETRHWQEGTRSTIPGRLKSDADDYRYFPEPDLPPVRVDQAWVDRLIAQQPELPAQRHARLRAAWGFEAAVFRDILHAGTLDIIEETVAAGASPQAARTWWMGDIARVARERGVAVTELGMTPSDVVELESLLLTGAVSSHLARQLLGQVIDGHGRPRDILGAGGVGVMVDDGLLNKTIDAAITAHPEVVQKIHAGKVQAIGALIGAVMRATEGQADPGRVTALIRQRLGISR